MSTGRPQQAEPNRGASAFDLDLDESNPEAARARASAAAVPAFDSDDEELSDEAGEVHKTLDGDEVVVTWEPRSSGDRIEMMRFNPTTHLARIFPRARGGALYENPFERVTELQLFMPKWTDTPPTEVSDLNFLVRLQGLPRGFNPVFVYGLGISRPYRGIIQEIETESACTVVRLTLDGSEGAHGERFDITVDRFERFRQAVERTKGRAATAANRVIEAEQRNSVNELFGKVAATPKFGKNPTIRAFTEEVATGYVTNAADRSALVDEVARQAPTVAQENPERFGKLREDIELVSLETLIEQYGRGLTGARAKDEAHWQSFFMTNPFSLQQIFSAPILIVGEQIHVQGTNPLGGESRITDFLCVNAVTRSAIAVEIKTPATKLMTSTQYRGEGAARIYPTHKELSGAVAQVEAQMESVMHELKDHPSFGTIDKWHVSGAVVIGTVSSLSTEQNESFLRFREGLGKVQVIGFDEISERLKHLHTLLSDPGAGSTAS
ncbi:Shedu anti-phage system protein SduA domain-containing protein [Curtobacterium sp. MCPF17_021]|uniref:Shedu anti-phage system protein SduA domain-containing protein n=1 Tax=Curtobacterium sp. MCPF17_021 TaxID=2175639 RepID=UPI000DAA4D75|nr:Shedu anti-phage system protein SduA domain-containing protein [Curtobacterium sp. MCPF17_021]WIE84429.1 DUF4263 domain-containing protein [Curtobacterium sp. MCPF17_021]